MTDILKPGTLWLKGPAPALAQLARNKLGFWRILVDDVPLVAAHAWKTRGAA